jgi:hypothetical protein
MGHVRSSLMSRTSRTTLVPEAFQLRDSAQCSRMLLVRMIFFVRSNHTAFKLCSLWHVG